MHQLHPSSVAHMSDSTLRRQGGGRMSDGEIIAAITRREGARRQRDFARHATRARALASSPLCVALTRFPALSPASSPSPYARSAFPSTFPSMRSPSLPQATSDAMRTQLRAQGVSVDDKDRTWTTTDGRRGTFAQDPPQALPPLASCADAAAEPSSAF